MEKVFEDELMELHTACISLCLEAVPNADKVYAYCSIERAGYMFNAFFVVDREIRTLGKAGVSGKRAMALLSDGTRGLTRYEDLCGRYGHPVPAEIKMVYDVRGKKLDVQYGYEEVVSSDAEICAEDVFTDWYDQVLKSSR